MRVTQRDVSATKRHNGAWECSAMIGGYRVERTYYGYTKREAVRLFVERYRYDGTEGQDRKSYSDTQDRDSYMA